MTMRAPTRRLMTPLFLLCATVAARYSSCAAVEIGESCCPEELGILECTHIPELTQAPDGRTIVSGPHEVARCEASGDGYTWQVYDVCNNGRQCLVEDDGSDYQCDFP